MESIRTAAAPDAARVNGLSAAGPALAAIVFGAFLLWGAGFAHSDLIHDAAHDSRHSFAFPCH